MYNFKETDVAIEEIFGQSKSSLKGYFKNIVVVISPYKIDNEFFEKYFLGKIPVLTNFIKWISYPLDNFFREIFDFFAVNDLDIDFQRKGFIDLGLKQIIIVADLTEKRGYEGLKKIVKESVFKQIKGGSVVKTGIFVIRKLKESIKGEKEFVEVNPENLREIIQQEDFRNFFDKVFLIDILNNDGKIIKNEDIGSFVFHTIYFLLLLPFWHAYNDKENGINGYIDWLKRKVGLSRYVFDNVTGISLLFPADVYLKKFVIHSGSNFLRHILGKNDKKNLERYLLDLKNELGLGTVEGVKNTILSVLKIEKHLKEEIPVLNYLHKPDSVGKYLLKIAEKMVNNFNTLVEYIEPFSYILATETGKKFEDKVKALVLESNCNFELLNKIFVGLNDSMDEFIRDFESKIIDDKCLKKYFDRLKSEIDKLVKELKSIPTTKSILVRSVLLLGISLMAIFLGLKQTFILTLAGFLGLILSAVSYLWFIKLRKERIKDLKLSIQKIFSKVWKDLEQSFISRLAVKFLIQFKDTVLKIKDKFTKMRNRFEKWADYLDNYSAKKVGKFSNFVIFEPSEEYADKFLDRYLKKIEEKIKKDEIKVDKEFVEDWWNYVTEKGLMDSENEEIKENELQIIDKFISRKFLPYVEDIVDFSICSVYEDDKNDERKKRVFNMCYEQIKTPFVRTDPNKGKLPDGNYYIFINKNVCDPIFINFLENFQNDKRIKFRIIESFSKYVISMINVVEAVDIDILKIESEK